MVNYKMISTMNKKFLFMLIESTENLCLSAFNLIHQLSSLKLVIDASNFIPILEILSFNLFIVL